MMKGCSSGGCRNPNIHNSRDQPDYSIKPENLQPLLTPDQQNSTSNMTHTPFNHHHHQIVQVKSSEQGRSISGSCYSNKQPKSAVPMRRSRWTPTPEQLMALEEMYRSGLKTLTAPQIRLVTAQLRNYGRIEGKNVFYWFQNHRARERQKRRRQLMSMYQSDHSKQQQQTLSNTSTVISSLQDKGSAAVGLPLEAEQQNKWTILPNNFTILSDQESSSVVQERMMSMVKSSSSMQHLEQSDSPGPASDTNASATLVRPKLELLDFHHYHDYDYGMVLTATNVYSEGEEEHRENQTLELFPLESENLKDAKVKLPPSITASTDVTTADFLTDRPILSISLSM